MYAKEVEILTGALKNVLQAYRDTCDEVENEVGNVFKTSRQVIDKMGKVSLSHIKQRPRENRDVSRWDKDKKHEKVFVLFAPSSKLRNSITVLHHS